MCHRPLMGFQSSRKLHKDLQVTMFLLLLMKVDWNKISDQLVTLPTSKYALEISTSGIPVKVLLSKNGIQSELKWVQIMIKISILNRPLETLAMAVF